MRRKEERIKNGMEEERGGEEGGRRDCLPELCVRRGERREEERRRGERGEMERRGGVKMEEEKRKSLDSYQK